jgi:hypothetical protein
LGHAVVDVVADDRRFRILCQCEMRFTRDRIVVDAPVRVCGLTKTVALAAMFNDS